VPYLVRLREIGSHFSFFNCTHTCTHASNGCEKMILERSASKLQNPLGTPCTQRNGTIEPLGVVGSNQASATACLVEVTWAGIERIDGLADTNGGLLTTWSAGFLVQGQGVGLGSR